jgi:Abortive infection C-terminus
MSLESPQQNKQLSYALQKLLNKMFAGETGFSGPQILDYFSEYSLDIEHYPSEGRIPSRWQIFEDCLSKFDLDQQRGIISNLLDYQGPMKYGRPSDIEVGRIREWLGEGRTLVAMPATSTGSLNWTFVYREWIKASERVISDPASAITSARSLLESVCKHILDDLSIPYDNGWDLQRLYRSASRELTLSPDQQAEDVFRQVMGGCATVANGLAGMRNQFSDAHGRGQGQAEAVVRHARLAVNAACTVAMFLIETHLSRNT